MEMKKNVTGNTLEIMLEGRLDTNTSPEFEKEVYSDLEGINELILDLDKLTYMSSAGLRVVLSCQKKMNAAKGTMIVKHVNALIMEIFEATGFDSILTIENDV